MENYLNAFLVKLFFCGCDASGLQLLGPDGRPRQAAGVRGMAGKSVVCYLLIIASGFIPKLGSRPLRVLPVPGGDGRVGARPKYALRESLQRPRGKALGREVLAGGDNGAGGVSRQLKTSLLLILLPLPLLALRHCVKNPLYVQEPAFRVLRPLGGLLRARPGPPLPHPRPLRRGGLPRLRLRRRRLLHLHRGRPLGLRAGGGHRGVAEAAGSANHKVYRTRRCFGCFFMTKY